MEKINKRVVAGIPSRNEEFILKKTLYALSQFCYKIIVVDDGSTDTTEEICNKFDKVEFFYRKRIDPKAREDGLQREEILKRMAKYNPDYCLFVDADEIPSPDIVNFINNIDPKINLWSFPWIHLWKDEDHYRYDSYKIQGGQTINWDPFNGGQRKWHLMKFNKNIKYKYHLNKPCSSGMHPKNVPLPHSTSDKTRIIHWRKISPFFLSGEHDIEHAKYRTYEKGGSIEAKIQRHKTCASEKTLKLRNVPKDWKW